MSVTIILCTVYMKWKIGYTQVPMNESLRTLSLAKQAKHNLFDGPVVNHGCFASSLAHGQFLHLSIPASEKKINSMAILALWGEKKNDFLAFLQRSFCLYVSQRSLCVQLLIVESQEKLVKSCSVSPSFHPGKNFASLTCARAPERRQTTRQTWYHTRGDSWSPKEPK